MFDEIEKAHPDVMNILLQILDEGRINDSQGRTVNFENTVICMTSNAGSNDKVNETGFNKSRGDVSKAKTMRALNNFLRPEFLARIDEVVILNPLSEDTLNDIADLMLTARDIRRVIRKEVEDKIAEIIVDNRDVKSVYAYEENGDIKVKFE